MTTRMWIAVALLSGSWLFGQTYYEPAAWLPWALCIIIGTVLLAGSSRPAPSRSQALAAVFLLLIAAWFFPFPGKAAVLLLAIGAALAAAGGPRAVLSALLTAGAVLTAQWITVSLWADFVARSHELPWILAGLVTSWIRLLGANAMLGGDAIGLVTAHQVHPLGATWELLFDPALLAFFAGGAVLAGFDIAFRAVPEERYRAWLGRLRTLAVLILVWIPIRCGLLVGLYLHRSAMADLTEPLTTMNVFLSGWVHLLLLAGPVFLAARFVHPPSPAPETAGPSHTSGPETSSRGVWFGAAALAGAFLLFAWAAYWEPTGGAKEGRILFVERHSTWEPTTEPYDTTRYGELASYNYAAVYDYCSRFFDVGRILPNEPIDRESLAGAAVLIIKTPTEPYARDEIDAIERFVRKGGSVLLIGDHTNVFKMTNYLNDISKRFGFTFRDDLLFRVGSAYDQEYTVPPVPHPSVRQVPPMWFAVSCSVNPGTSRGRAAIQNGGLWSLPPEYHHENYHPRAAYRADMRYGPFIQLWATRPGAGRVLAFTDSTIFSNFCVFQEGKAELFVNMLDWLRRRSAFDSPVLRLTVRAAAVLLGIALLVAAVMIQPRNRAGWLLGLAAVLGGWTLGCLVVNAVHARAMPAPVPRKPLTQVVIDQAVSRVPLARGAFNLDADGAGFGLFEQWIGKVGYFTARREEGVFGGDCLVVICPTRSIGDAYRAGLVEFVRGGGRLLVVDTVYNPESTVNTLLWPFDMTVTPTGAVQGTLSVRGEPTEIVLSGACVARGGEPVATVGDHVVVAEKRVGDGTVTVVGCGSAFNDAAMGYNWMLPPDAKTLERYEVLFRLLRAVVEGKDAAGAPRPESPPPEDAAHRAVSVSPHSG